MNAADLDTSRVAYAVFDALGERIGRLAAVYVDPDTREASFAGVGMMRKGRRRIVLVPLADATVEQATITVKCGKQLARRSPSLRPGEKLAAADEPALFAHYDMPYAPTAATGRLLADSADFG